MATDMGKDVWYRGTDYRYLFYKPEKLMLLWFAGKECAVIAYCSSSWMFKVLHVYFFNNLVRQVAMRALGFDVKKADVLKILKDYDREGNGKITFEDFNEVVTDWILDRDPHEEILKAFKLFDDDDSGKISLRNLRRVARELGENMTDEELRAMIEEFDKDGDGEINQEEFIAIMTGDV
ncbi:hypothetical protein JD844_017928 [Phrynosoma platyrhinos]|uniref:Calglandulin n=1 Tax=Phrynosoma platyrhinos TaxID=52577 RepID=A0ABQ7SMM0_PHRPL|nr:hypothetical protein JD844_017928 [Phrynosoma platyrhinos]